MKSSTNPNSTPQRERIVLVTGASGAGRATAVRAMEDVGFEAIDNLPLSLLPRLLDGPALDKPLVLGLDVRNRDFSAARLIDLFDSIEANGRFKADLMFLDCAPDVLIRRFSETRRPHPLAPTETPVYGVDQEIELLGPVRDRATILLDTSDLSPHDLRAELAQRFAEKGKLDLTVSLQSFSYKRGIPRGVDMVFDVRFLRNPHWEPDLRALDGRDAAVGNYVADDPRHQTFFQQVEAMLDLLLPAFSDEGKTHVAIAFGCTGGQHRSVAATESVANTLEAKGWRVSKRHRELERSARIAAGEAKAIGMRT